MARHQDVNRDGRAGYSKRNETNERTNARRRNRRDSGGGEKLLAEDRRELAELGRLAPAIYLQNISGRTKNGHSTSARSTQIYTNAHRLCDTHEYREDRFHVNYIRECAVEFVGRANSPGRGSFKANSQFISRRFIRVIFH